MRDSHGFSFALVREKANQQANYGKNTVYILNALSQCSVCACEKAFSKLIKQKQIVFFLNSSSTYVTVTQFRILNSFDLPNTRKQKAFGKQFSFNLLVSLPFFYHQFMHIYRNYKTSGMISLAFLR